MRSVPLAALLLSAALLAGPARAAEGGDDKDGDGKAPKHKVTQSDSYMMVDPLYLPIFEGDRPVGMLMIGVGIDIPDPRLRAEAEHAMPILRDGFVRNLMNFSTTSVRSWRQPDAAAIADRLQRVTDRVLRRKGARLLLAQVAMRISK
ncbi:MAG: hypothetical protein WDN01_17165 [Rhizomicrobium sp.]